MRGLHHGKEILKMPVRQIVMSSISLLCSRNVALYKNHKKYLFSAARSSRYCHSYSEPASVAVGIAVTGYPPRRSGHALLTHPAPTSGSGVEALHGIRVCLFWSS